jgi:hypothetical protein
MINHRLDGLHIWPIIQRQENIKVMVKENSVCYSRNPRRACLKTLLVVGFTALCVWGLSLTLDHSALDHLKFELSLWTMIALVLITNLVSFACFIVLYAAYNWVRCDLKPPRAEDVQDVAEN